MIKVLIFIILGFIGDEAEKVTEKITKKILKVF
jgi:hypothetical protein